MRKNIWRLSLAFSLFLSILCTGVSQAAFASPGPTPVTSGMSAQSLPRTDGKTVVWNDYRTGDRNNADVYATDLTTGKESAVATGPLDQRMPDVDGNIVVWEQGQPCPQPSINPLYAATTSTWVGCHRDIYAKNLMTGQVFAVANSSSDQSDPAISGSWIVWVASNTPGQYMLQASDINTMGSVITLARLNAPVVTHRVDIDGNRVVWGEESTDTSSVRHWRLLTIQIGESNPTVLDQGTADNDQFSWDLHGDTVVYAFHNTSFILKTINLKYGDRLTPTFPNQQLPANPTTDGRYIFFEDYQALFDSKGATLNLQGYDLLTGSYFGIVVNNGYNAAPFMRGGILVWQSGQPQTSVIYSSAIINVLPSAKQAPVPSTADRYYFPDTQHTLSFGFKYFWDHSGGLPIFGYPLTEEFSETNSDTGKVYTVQYFERERYEYHPEFKGTPYETELGRLGAIDAQQRGLSGTGSFQTVPNSNDPNCTYFSQTGHNACGTFRSYWQSHGLEFGDPSISFRESVALFGYPISEQFVQNGTTVQYFERAVLEYHPEKPQPYTILLRRLGTDLLTQRNW